MENLVKAKQLSEFFRNKKVFITGHTGFKGSWLLATLHFFGAECRGYALAPEYADGIFNCLSPFNIGSGTFSDIRDKHRLEKEIIDFQPDFIYHLAAQPLVRRSYEIPAETFDINATGTANLLESVRSLKKRCSIVIVTTDKVYHNKENSTLYKEDDLLGGYDPYSASKACAEIIVSSFRQSFFNSSDSSNNKSLSTARAGNVIGGGDWSKNRILPDIVHALTASEEINVRNPSSMRPWQHVLEAISGYLMLGIKMHTDPDLYSKAYNFGPLPEDHLSVKHLVETAVKLWGGGSWIDTSTNGEPHEAGLLKLDISRAMNELNWKPKLNAEQAIEWTIKWYKRSSEEKAEFTFSQIEEYFRL